VFNPLYLLFWVAAFLYLCCLVCWAGGLLYSLFFDRRRRRWLTPVLAGVGLVLLPPLLFFALSNYHTVSSVSGTYEGSFGGGTDTLALRPDSTFRQRFVTGEGKVYASAGRWTLTENGSGPLDPDGSTTIAFDKIIIHAGNSGQPQHPKVSSFPYAEVDSSSICFSTNPEDYQGNCFTRIHE